MSLKADLIATKEHVE